MTEIGIFRGEAPPFIVLAISLAASSYIMPHLVNFVFDSKMQSKRGIRRWNFGSVEKVFFGTGLLLVGALTILPLLCIARIVGIAWVGSGRVVVVLDTVILMMTYLLVFANPAVLWLNKVPPVQDNELPRGGRKVVSIT